MILQIEQCRVGEGERRGKEGNGTGMGERAKGGLGASGRGVGRRRGQRNTRSASTMHCARENQHSRWQRGGNILLGTDFQDFQRPEKREEKKKMKKKEDIILRPEADEPGRRNREKEGGVEGEFRREIIS